jgi:hypothetical protein
MTAPNAKRNNARPAQRKMAVTSPPREPGSVYDENDALRSPNSLVISNRRGVKGFGAFSGHLRSSETLLHVGRLQSYVALLRVSPLMANDLLHQIDSLARRHRRFVLDRLKVE